ncbi:HAMP domain-containing protein, partial [Pseudorhizobium pelagicum]|uniref:HAMP domain-containing protein n=2 Tax=Pseudorhizobium pelagicum TaxID=1509405 RepID=UPI00117B93BB
MSRPKVKTALAGILILLGMAFAGFATFAVNRLGAIEHDLTFIATNAMPSVLTVKDIEVQVTSIRNGYRSHILRGDAEGKANAAKGIDAAWTAVVEDANKFRSLDPTAQEDGLLKSVEDQMKSYISLGARVLALSELDDIQGANEILRTEMVKPADAAKAALSQLVEISMKGAAGAHDNAKTAYQRTLTVTYLAIGLLAVIISAAVWFTISSIANPIHTITDSMNKLARGDADTAIPYAGRTDEIGEMAAAVEVFRTNAVENRRLEQETAHQRSQTEEQRRRTAEQERVRAEAMAKATAGLAGGLKQLSSGNLTFQLSEAFADEFESLRADFNQAITQLRETMVSVAGSTSSIDSGSREVSQSA